MSRVIVVQHAACEALGGIADALDRAGHTTEILPSFEGHPVPTGPGQASGLILMGGPMSVYEQGRYPFLNDEIRLIEKTLGLGKPVLGVCLGSQLLAAALGATVRPGKQKEIGWYPVRPSDAGRSDRLFSSVEPTFTAYHWHGDIFDLPRGCTNLASSELTPCQAFRHGTLAYGLLFHTEVTRPMIAAMVDTFAAELMATGIAGADCLAKADIYLPPLTDVARSVFGNWVRLIPEGEGLIADSKT